MNALWIMVDQMRWDYLSCYGAKHIKTPNIDWLASRGVTFNKAYVQSPICGPARMSFYTGRYTRSHGATWNGFPLRVGEPTLGDHLRDQGVSCNLVGKTHMMPDKEGMARLGIDPESTIGKRVGEGGFDVFIRDDGNNNSDCVVRHSEDYDKYLRSHGMDGDNPWEEWANTAERPDGSLCSGWMLENSKYPARVPKEHSETAWLTTRGIDFIEAQGDDPWLCHLSYIKPHWPYLAPAPYNDMYSASDLPPVNRSEKELLSDHPLMQAWTKMRVSKSFSRDDVRDVVGPAYMGLIKELDDQMGRLFEYLKDSGRMEDTMVVFCSDHGDNLGDHWMGEKDLFYDCSARVPLIVYDPRREANSTRGMVTDKLVEGIDLVPTFLDAFGGPPLPHILEGLSLQPILHDLDSEWRTFCVSEYDYSTRDARRAVQIDQKDARLVMIFDGRWKLTHVENMRPMLFDLEIDPKELNDLGNDPDYKTEIVRLSELHFEWARRHHNRITRAAETVEKMTDNKEPAGVMIGYWNQEELEPSGRRLPKHIENKS